MSIKLFTDYDSLCILYYLAASLYVLRRSPSSVLGSRSSFSFLLASSRSLAASDLVSPHRTVNSNAELSSASAATMVRYAPGKVSTVTCKVRSRIKGCRPSDQIQCKCMPFSCGSEIGGEIFACHLQYFMLRLRDTVLC